MKLEYKKINDLLVKILKISIETAEKIDLDEGLEEYGLDSCMAIQFFVLVEEELKLEILYDNLKFENIKTKRRIFNFLNESNCFAN